MKAERERTAGGKQRGGGGGLCVCVWGGRAAGWNGWSEKRKGGVSPAPHTRSGLKSTENGCYGTINGKKFPDPDRGNGRLRERRIPRVVEEEVVEVEVEEVVEGGGGEGALIRLSLFVLKSDVML